MGTKRNLLTQWKAFLLFCTYFDFIAIPASLRIICLYNRSFKSVESIKNYLCGVKTLHLFLDKPFRHLDDFSVKLLFKGIARSKQHLPKQASAITIDMLLDFYHIINHEDPKQCTIWCLFLFAFFLMARKSNLVPDSRVTFNKDKHLTRNKVIIDEDIAIVIFNWSKTLQMGDRVLKIPLVENPGSKLCPITAYKNMCRLVPAVGDNPAFLFPSKNGVVPVTYVDFQYYIKQL